MDQGDLLLEKLKEELTQGPNWEKIEKNLAKSAKKNLETIIQERLSALLLFNFPQEKLPLLEELLVQGTPCQVQELIKKVMPQWKQLVAEELIEIQNDYR